MEKESSTQDVTLLLLFPVHTFYLFSSYQSLLKAFTSLLTNCFDGALSIIVKVENLNSKSSIILERTYLGNIVFPDQCQS